MSDLPLPKDTVSLLIDGHGILLEKSTDTEQWKPFRRGFSFGEECVGTNAVSLALPLRKSAWTFPEQNYCALLSRFSLYALPPTRFL